MSEMRKSLVIALSLFALIAAACSPAATPVPATAPNEPTATPPPPTVSVPSTEAPIPTNTAAPEPQVLRLATTTSTADSGLLDAILPDFEAKYNARVDVVAVGTGQALTIGARGDADVVLVHARAKEDQFVKDGDGINRLDVMYNDFVVVGPEDDPAKIAGLPTAKEALAKIAEAHVGAARVAAPYFASRGDDSGTYTKEKAIWASTGITPTVESGWYFSLGQGMGETLNFANEKPAYTVSDRGTWLSQAARLPNLILLVGGSDIQQNKDKSLLNPYGVILVNPDKHPGVNAKLADQFETWLTSLATQQLIADYGKDKFGQSLFYPSSDEWKRAHP
ncbi:MAG: substrate-binding domain-containing protein [Chloroflexi bacterium]|nr:substrate-binding domain-containing protein [Chloroflexota bacterium]